MADAAAREAQRGLERGEAHAELRHACRVGLDAELAHLAADRNHLRDAAERAAERERT